MSDIKHIVWTRERIQEFIDNKIEEGPQLDYKAAAALSQDDRRKNEITKDISAFANSAGGIVVYGLKEFDDDAKKHLPEKIDPIDGREIPREWLDQVIGQISPRIVNLLITPLRVGPETWHTCYVVEIPQGHTSHQARDLRYYRRYNFESVPMADYEIRDIMNRRGHPKLEFRIRLIITPQGIFKILGRIWNKGSVIAKHYKIRILMPTIVGESKLWREGLIVQESDGFKFWRVALGNPLSHPIFPDDDIIIEHEIPWTFNEVPKPSADFILCTLFADEMPGVKRKISVESALKDWA